MEQVIQMIINGFIMENNFVRVAMGFKDYA